MHTQTATPAVDKRYLALRNFAISLTVFNVLGYLVLGFEQPYLWPFIALATGYTAELVLEVVDAWARGRRPRFLGGGFQTFWRFLLPAHITSLAVNMLLYANNQILPIILGVFIGVAGKHLFQAPVNGRMRHFMNPSNFGIAVTLVLFGSWVSIAPPYQFTENADTFWRFMIPIIIVTAGTVLNTSLTGKVPLIVGWLGAFAIQALVRHWIWDVALAPAFASMTGVAFVLFTNYMISDPGTTPSKPRAQFMFGSSVAIVYGVLMQFNVTYTLFFALVIVCGIRGAGLWAIHFRDQRRAEPAATRSPETHLGITPTSEAPDNKELEQAKS